MILSEMSFHSTLMKCKYYFPTKMIQLLERKISRYDFSSKLNFRCGCEDCTESRSEDSLRHSRSRINAYRALASPSLIALSSKDPILTAFELSWELRRLAFSEHEFKSEYLVNFINLALIKRLTTAIS